MTADEFNQTQFYKDSVFTARFAYAQEDGWEEFSRRYDAWTERNSCGQNLPQGIPHIVHQLWVGSPLPEKYKDWCKSWQVMNPGWEYRLWTEENLGELFTAQEMEWFRASRNFGPKSDLFRYAVLDHIGGFYCDTDFECLRNFDFLADSCTLLSGTGIIDKPEILAGLIGSVKGHPLMKATLEALLAVDIANLEQKDILETTGPAFLTREFFAHKDLLLENDVIFPSTFFYPFPNTDRNKKITQRRIKTKYTTKKSCAVHYWEMSWTNTTFFGELWCHTKQLIKKIIFFDRWKKLLKKE